MKKKAFLAILIIFILLLSISCAPGYNTGERIPDEEGKIAGFWYGLWHGIITPITFIISLFSDNVNFYEVHNNGGWYNFGFLIGIGAWAGGSIKINGRRKKSYQ